MDFQNTSRMTDKVRFSRFAVLAIVVIGEAALALEGPPSGAVAASVSAGCKGQTGPSLVAGMVPAASDYRVGGEHSPRDASLPNSARNRGPEQDPTDKGQPQQDEGEADGAQEVLGPPAALSENEPSVREQGESNKASPETSLQGQIGAPAEDGKEQSEAAEEDKPDTTATKVHGAATDEPLIVLPEAVFEELSRAMLESAESLRLLAATRPKEVSAADGRWRHLLPVLAVLLPLTAGLIALVTWSRLIAPLLNSSTRPADGRDASEDSRKATRTLGLLFVAATLGVSLLWMGSAAFTFHMSPVTRSANEFAEAFGLANTLFSGLAFAGVIIAIILQSVELRYQRHELKNQLVELKSNRVEQRKNAKIQGYHGLWGHYSSLQTNQELSPIGEALAEGREQWCARQIHELLEVEDEVFSATRRAGIAGERGRFLALDFFDIKASWDGLFIVDGDSVRLRPAVAGSFLNKFCVHVTNYASAEELEYDEEGIPDPSASEIQQALFAVREALWRLDTLVGEHYAKCFRGQPKENWPTPRDFGVRLGHAEAREWFDTGFEPARAAVRECALYSAANA